MKALFAHNIRIKEDVDGKLYTHSSYNESVWKRYKTISDTISVVVRGEDQVYDIAEAQSKFERFDNSKMDIVYVEDIHKSIISFLNPFNHIKNNKILKKAVKDNDCIIARLPSYPGFKAVKYAKDNELPYICEVVACSWDGLWNHSLKGKVMAPFSWARLKRVVRDAPYVVYVTNEFLQRRYPTGGKNTNCSNVALSEFDERIIEKRVKKIESMKSDNKLVIGTTAAVDVRYKGQQYIIKALGNLKNKGLANFEYQVVGGGDQTYLKSIATKYDVIDQVKFLGAMPHNKVFDWLETIDIYTQPSRQEGLPRALIEAMSRGLPSFGARTAGIPELLESEFIFSNTRKNINEICSILKSFDKETMVNQAKRNYKESKNYDKEIIEKRRKKFFMEFENSLSK